MQDSTGAMSCNRDAATTVRQNRNLTLILSILLIITNTVSAGALHFLPSDPFHLAFNSALYCSFGALISVFGLFGVCNHNATLITVFSNHLFLDAIISTIPRILLLSLFSSLPASICTAFILPQTPANANDGRWESEFALSPIDEWMAQPWMAQQCTTAMWVAEGIVGVLILGMTALQWMAAWRVRDFARAAERWENRERLEEEGEKKSVGV